MYISSRSHHTQNTISFKIKNTNTNANSIYKSLKYAKRTLTTTNFDCGENARYSHSPQKVSSKGRGRAAQSTAMATTNSEK